MLIVFVTYTNHTLSFLLTFKNIILPYGPDNEKEPSPVRKRKRELVADKPVEKNPSAAGEFSEFAMTVNTVQSDMILLNTGVLINNLNN